MNDLKKSLNGIWLAFLLLIRSRKFWLALAGLIVVWANPGALADKINQTIAILMTLGGLITVEDAALKSSGKLPHVK